MCLKHVPKYCGISIRAQRPNATHLPGCLQAVVCTNCMLALLFKYYYFQWLCCISFLQCTCTMIILAILLLIFAVTYFPDNIMEKVTFLKFDDLADYNYVNWSQRSMQGINFMFFLCNQKLSDTKISNKKVSNATNKFTRYTCNVCKQSFTFWLF